MMEIPEVAMLLLKLPAATAKPPASTDPTAVFNVQEVLELCLPHPAAWLQETLCEETVHSFLLPGRGIVSVVTLGKLYVLVSTCD